MNDDGMRLRVRAMLTYMNIKETPQPNKGRIHINKAELIQEVTKNGGSISFDTAGYTKFKQEETTANKFPDVPQQVRPRFRPAKADEGPPGTFIREGGDDVPPPPLYKQEDHNDPRHDGPARRSDSYQQERRDSRRSTYPGEDRGPRGSWQQDRRGSYGGRNAPDQEFESQRSFERRGHYEDDTTRGNAHGGRKHDSDSRGLGGYTEPRSSHNDAYGDQDRRGREPETVDRRGSYREHDAGGRYERDRRPSQYDADRFDDRVDDRRSFQRPSHREERFAPREIDNGRGFPSDHDMSDRRPPPRKMDLSDRPGDRGFDNARPTGPAFPDSRSGQPFERTAKRQRHSFQQFGEPAGHSGPRQKRASDSMLYVNRREGGGGTISSEAIQQFAGIKEEDPDPYSGQVDDSLEQETKKRGFDDDQKPAANRGYNIEPSYAKRRGA
jgi:hypothetical protein